MSWTPPGTVSVGEVATDALWNETVRDNLQFLYTGSGGWADLSYFGACAYVSADSPTFVMSVAADVTGVLSPGARIKLTQSSTVKYFIVTAVGAFGSGVTNITLYGGTSYTLANSAITLPFFSYVKAPFGFPTDPTGWTVTLSDSTNRLTSSPVANTWYNANNIVLPIGAWKTRYQATGYYDVGALTTPSADTRLTLSTANNTESDGDLSSVGRCYVTVTSQTIFENNPYLLLTRDKTLVVAAKTTYFLNYACTVTQSGATLGLINTPYAKCIIRAECAYL